MDLTAGSLLVATPNLSDPNFMRSVVYVMEHNAEGTLGFIINRAVTIPLSDLWGDCPDEIRDIRIACEGGPVERNKGLLLHACPDLPGCHPMGMGVAIGGELDALVKRFHNGPDHRGPRLFLGHTGWAPGQLDAEIAQGTWTVQAGSSELLLHVAPADDLWNQLAHSDTDGGPFHQPSLN